MLCKIINFHLPVYLKSPFDLHASYIMKMLAFFVASLLVTVAYAAPTTNSPTSKNSDVVVVDDEFFPDEFIVYRSEYDIVNILVPLNALNFEDDSDDSNEESDDSNTVIFFILADTENGQRVDKGLYIRKKGVVTKLLDHGRDASAVNDDTKTAYFGAQDGIYIYNAEKNKAEKYGTLTDSIIGIAKVNGTDLIYILTDDHVVYKVTEEGTKKEKLENVVDAQQIVLDYESNLYYYTSDKKVYVYGPDGVKQFHGLPEHVSYVSILKPPFIIENGVLLVMDSKTFIVYVNGTVENGDFELRVRPTAYNVEATLIQYYAYNKKIYEYNVLALLLTEVLSGLKEKLEESSNMISEIATRSRSDLRA